MTRRRSKKAKTDETVASSAPLPPKIVTMLGEEFAEPNVTPPPKTVVSQMSSSVDTVPALPMELLASEEPQQEVPVHSEVIPPREHKMRYSVVADDTVPELPMDVVYPEQAVAAQPPSVSKSKKWWAIVWGGAAAIVLIGGLGIVAVKGYKKVHGKIQAAVPESLATVERPAAPRVASVDVRVKPRFGIPEPAPAEAGIETETTGYAALSLLDEWLAGLSGDKPDPMIAVRRAGLALFNPLFGLREAEANKLDVPARAAVMAYAHLFQDLGRLHAATATVMQLVQAGVRLGDQLADVGGLEIRRVLVCRNVSGFGRYDPLIESAVRARHVSLLQAYVEFAHPKPEIREDGRYVYRLSQSLRMRRADKEQGAPIMDTTLSLTELSLSPKRDFFSAQYLQPAQPLTPGAYILEVSLTDQVGGTTSRGKATLTVLSDQ